MGGVSHGLMVGLNVVVGNIACSRIILTSYCVAGTGITSWADPKRTDLPWLVAAAVDAVVAEQEEDTNTHTQLLHWSIS